MDASVLDWITREPLRREWFFKERDSIHGTGQRLRGSLAFRSKSEATEYEGCRFEPAAITCF